MDPRKWFGLLVAGLFIVGMLPIAAFGDDRGSKGLDAGVGIDARIGISAEDDDQDDNKNETNDDDEDDENVDGTEASVDTKGGVKARASVDASGNKTREERIDERKERVEKKAEEAEEKSAEIRGRQKAHIEAAISECSAKFDSDLELKCKEKLEARLEKIEKLAEKDLARIEKIKEHRLEQVAKLESLLKQKVYSKFKAGKAREVRKEIVEKAREAFEESREELKEAKGKFESEKKAFAELKTQVKSCGAKTDEACESARIEIKLKAKGMANETVTLMIGHLKKVKARIEESEQLTTDEAAAAVAALDAKIEELVELQARVDAVNEETSKEDVQKLVQDIAKKWKLEIKAEAEHRTGFVMASKMGGIIVRSEKLSAKLDHVIEVAVEKGIDTAAVQSDVDKFNALLAEAQQQHEKASTLFEDSAKLTGEARRLKVKEAHEVLKTAQASLKDAHSVLKEVTKKLHEQKLDEELDSPAAEASVAADARASDEAAASTDAE